MSLRVAFDITSAVKREPAGIAVYIRGLLAALPGAAPDLDPLLCVRDGRWFKRRLAAGLLPEAPRRWVPADFVLARGYDRYHGLGVRLPAHCRAPRSFTLHDLRGLDATEWTSPDWIRKRSARIRQTVARADAVLFHTEHARARFFAHFPDFSPAATGVALPGVDHGSFQPQTPEEQARACTAHGIDRPFLLQVGAPVPHKNPEASLHAFAASQASAGGVLLVFAGRTEPARRAELEALAQALGVAPRVRWLGRVPAEDLPALYSAASCVLMPSHYEGFGFPVLEAMACGAAGAASRGTSLEELAAGAWPLVDPADSGDLARAIDRMLIHPAAREEAAAAARVRAADFTWEACARSTAAFLRRGFHSGGRSG